MIDRSPEVTPLDSALAQEGAGLLHAQCWLWGQDLHSPAGDLLHASGLRRAVFEDARSHRTYYQVRLARHFAVAWSGGLLFGTADGSLFFPRLRFSPSTIASRSLEEVPNLNALGSLEPTPLSTRERELVAAALDWLAEYEEGVLRIAGPAWRRECARRWEEIEEGAGEAAASVGVEYERLAPLPEDGLADAWRNLRGRTVNDLM